MIGKQALVEGHEYVVFVGAVKKLSINEDFGSGDGAEIELV